MIARTIRSASDAGLVGPRDPGISSNSARAPDMANMPYNPWRMLRLFVPKTRRS